MSWQLWWQITVWILLVGILAAFVKISSPNNKEDK